MPSRLGGKSLKDYIYCSDCKSLRESFFPLFFGLREKYAELMNFWKKKRKK